MAIQIEGGSNPPSAWDIVTGRGQVDSISAPKIIAQAASARAYQSTTDFVNITTTASATGLLYLQNTSNTEVVRIYSINVSSTQITKVRAIKNPTTGTLISAGAVLTPENSLFDTGKIFTGTIRKGSNAQTVTNGVLFMGANVSANMPYVRTYDGLFVLGPQNSIAITVQPTATADIIANIIFYTDQR